MSELTTHAVDDRVTTRRGRWLAATALAATALLGFGTAPALAATTVDGDTPVSLTVHKFISDRQGADGGDGTLIPDTSGMGTPAPGVEFSVQKVTAADLLDLTTNDGWQYAQELSGAFNGTPGGVGALTSTPIGPNADLASLGAAVTGTTGADGTVTFPDGQLDGVGLYLVTENPATAPQGAVPAAPFLVTLPITTKASEWLYDVHVYPKNLKQTFEKEVSSELPAVGDEVVYTLSGGISTSAGDYEYYRIVDGLHPLLTYAGDNGVGVRVVDPATGSTIATLQPGQDYAISHLTDAEAAQGGLSAAAGTDWIAIDLTASGLAILNANDGMRLELTLTAEVNALDPELEIDGIPQEATLFPNEDAWDGQNGTPSETNPTLKFGDITLLKADSTSDTITLAGATFQIYEVDPSQPGAQPLVWNNDPDSTDNSNLVDSVTSDADGIVDISGLALSNWDPNAGAEGDWIADSSEWKEYWLVETVAPDDYSLLAEPIRFFVTGDDGVLIDFTTGDLGGDPDMTVKNVKFNAGFALPLTGGTGLALIVGLGTLLVATGAVLVIARRRKARLDEAAATL
ncbi:SpaH/EbpB family LPXTG-anchored major pilin [uncultured Leifsonia sp.]|uniref:SpaH/EbpB family LPXTG-anchored major pilin n=1 Tax=uncultured Leifsonia sp. TaxID=340359 RepID=UPI0028D529A7|nr:SpaH/EbpB family LPXTG-anchored major pilin [uncultured Leifsonia sp.]